MCDQRALFSVAQTFGFSNPMAKGLISSCLWCAQNLVKLVSSEDFTLSMLQMPKSDLDPPKKREWELLRSKNRKIVIQKTYILRKKTYTQKNSECPLNNKIVQWAFLYFQAFVVSNLVASPFYHSGVCRSTYFWYNILYKIVDLKIGFF